MPFSDTKQLLTLLVLAPGDHHLSTKKKRQKHVAEQRLRLVTRHGCCEDLHLENEVGEEDQTEQVGGLESALFFI